MGFNRKYSRSEVDRILAESEGRARPRAPGEPAGSLTREGHAFKTHSNERPSVLERPPFLDAQGTPQPAQPPNVDTVFGSKEQLADAVHEALNSVPGQRQLVRLNSPATHKVEIRCILLRKRGEIDVTAVYRPEPEGQMSVDWLSALTGDSFILEMVVWVWRIPQTERIHIHSAFVRDYAGVTDGNIVGHSARTSRA